jgi:hypothetical protein
LDFTLIFNGPFRNVRSTFHCIYKESKVTKSHSLLSHVVKPAQYNLSGLCQFSVISIVRVKQENFKHYYMHSLRTQTTGCPDAGTLQMGDKKPSVRGSIEFCTNFHTTSTKKKCTYRFSTYISKLWHYLVKQTYQHISRPCEIHNW